MQISGLAPAPCKGRDITELLSLLCVPQGLPPWHARLPIFPTTYLCTLSPSHPAPVVCPGYREAEGRLLRRHLCVFREPSPRPTMFKQRGAMSPMRRERPPQAAQQDTLLSCPGGLRVVPCPQQMTCHLLLAPRAPPWSGHCPCHPPPGGTSLSARPTVSLLCAAGALRQGHREGVRACVCVHLSAPHLAEDGRSSPKETYSTSLCEGSLTPSAITASVLEAGSCAGS